VGQKESTLEELELSRSPMDLDQAFWAGRRVFVTGHTGFKGSWLCLWLQSLGAEVTGFALSPPTQPSLFELAGVSKGMHSVMGDVRNSSALTDALKASKAQIVLHLAAQPLVRQSYEDPIETFHTNVLGTANLLQAVRACSGIDAVINVTTDKCYENREWVWPYREDEPLGGHDPYSASKACSELVTSAYRRSFFPPERYHEHGVAVASARAGNVIGGGDWAKDRLIPDVISSFIKGIPVPIRNPYAIRPWQHVLEPLSGYLLLAERLCQNAERFSRSWNFGPAQEDAQPVQALVEHMAKLWGTNASFSVAQSTTAQPHEAHTLRLDISLAQQLLKWKPKLAIHEALKMTVEWAQKLHAGDNARELCIRQIQTYETSR
jgi:CDP-glucose 4,6-dehydratase